MKMKASTNMDQEQPTQWSEFSFILAPSSLGGIGVFAVHAIAKGTPLFSNTSMKRTIKVSDVPPSFSKYCIYLNRDEFICPERFDRMEIGWYINHSFTPNLKRIDGKLYAACDIKSGDEVFINYNELNEPEDLKEDYYLVK